MPFAARFASSRRLRVIIKRTNTFWKLILLPSKMFACRCKAGLMVYLALFSKHYLLSLLPHVLKLATLVWAAWYMSKIFARWERKNEEVKVLPLGSTITWDSWFGSPPLDVIPYCERMRSTIRHLLEKRQTIFRIRARPLPNFKYEKKKITPKLQSTPP